MIQLKQLTFNPFEESTFVLYDETKECVIIDPGCYTQAEKELLGKFIELNGLKPVMLANTHAHVDHMLGNHYVYDKWKPSVGLHRSDSTLWQNAVLQGQAYGFDVEEPPVADTWFEDNTDLYFGNSVIKILHVPGHSPGSVVFYSKEQKILIAGDVLFAGSIGRTDLPGGNYDQLMDGIYNKLLVLGPDTKVFPGHGPSTTIGDEIARNPFLLRLGQ